MLTVVKGKGKQSLDVVTKNNGKKVKKLKYRDIIAADLSDKDLAKLLRHPLFKDAKVELDPQRLRVRCQRWATMTVDPIARVMMKSVHLLHPAALITTS